MSYFLCADLDIGKPMTIDARRVDPTTVKQVYYFDSRSLAKSLETKGEFVSNGQNC